MYIFCTLHLSFSLLYPLICRVNKTKLYIFLLFTIYINNETMRELTLLRSLEWTYLFVAYHAINLTHKYCNLGHYQILLEEHSKGKIKSDGQDLTVLCTLSFPFLTLLYVSSILTVLQLSCTLGIPYPHFTIRRAICTYVIEILKYPR